MSPSCVTSSPTAAQRQVVCNCKKSTSLILMLRPFNYTYAMACFLGEIIFMSLVGMKTMWSHLQLYSDPTPYALDESKSPVGQPQNGPLRDLDNFEHVFYGLTMYQDLRLRFDHKVPGARSKLHADVHKFVFRRFWLGEVSLLANRHYASNRGASVFTLLTEC